ncbi:MAG TPA: sigma-54 dependent transcriptional regulator [Chitinophagaceae bacterium]|nr:sigma-54 dependent transcriptional regulator [Chitinophagaceae bacterium]HMZ46751.1 sigma-54 dependent transcriptional regulator [Chitinophagaceae bacterium]HNM34991.1 sigma-54 dependent transcriptional regulator [Chitinophagaceae bacterium]HNN32163.1 sigma-54 dependent transcriptional regulator [Chitinophagaceae bacterium]
MKEPRSFKIFIVEDDLWYSSMLSYTLSLNPDYQIKKFESSKTFIAALHEKPDVVSLDYSLPDATGEDVLDKINELSPETRVIVISGQEDVKVAINLLKKGAYDYIVKDEDTKDRLWNSIQHLRENADLKKEIEVLKEEVAKKYDFAKTIIGNSIAIKRVFNLMEKAVKNNITVSLTGETGTGKEVAAKCIHYNSDRRNKSFVAINVAAIPKELLESELFGHEKGAFTGAAVRRIGKFEEANKGTLFLDEIGEMDMNMQSKLLRALQERELSRVGSNEIIKFDVRIIVATHKNLLDEVKNGNFREDLYYRLLGLPINLPPLRERENDVLMIAKFYMEQFCKENKIPSKVLTTEAKKKLLNHSFPGNIRELKSVIELATVMAEDTEILPEHLNIVVQNVMENFAIKDATLKEFNVKLIQYYLDLYQCDVLKVAKKLDIGKSTIYRMIQNKELSVSKNVLDETIMN